MAEERGTPFDNLESAHEYVGLLCEALEEAQRSIQWEIDRTANPHLKRHLDALRLVDYKLTTLRHHFVASRRIINDLRSLRRYLLGERMPESHAVSTATDEPIRPAAMY